MVPLKITLATGRHVLPEGLGEWVAGDTLPCLLKDGYAEKPVLASTISVRLPERLDRCGDSSKAAARRTTHSMTSSEAGEDGADLDDGV